METRYILTSLLLSIFLLGCESAKHKKFQGSSSSTSHETTQIKLLGFIDSNSVTYKTQMADFIFSRSAVLQYCNDKDFSINNNFSYKQVIDYLTHFSNTSAVIYDTVGSELVHDSVVNFSSKSDTLIRIRNQKSPYSNVTDAIDWMLLDIVKAGNFKVFDHYSQKYIEFVVLDEVNTSYYGSKDILTPDGKRLFSKLTWIN